MNILYCAGPNAECSVQGSSAVCLCKKGYKGHPLSTRGCTPDCVRHSDCPPTKACINSNCVDPCPGACGIGAGMCLVFA